MNRIVLLLLFIFSLIQRGSCESEGTSFLWRYFKTDLIFAGKVIQVFESDSTTYDVNILIDRVFKGQKTDTIRLTVKSFAEEGAINYNSREYMRLDQKWLIFANRTKIGYFTGGHESGNHLVKEVKEKHPHILKWLTTFDSKTTDFYWDWEERDIRPEPENMGSIILNNFNIETRDTTTVHGIWAFILCNIDEHGKLTKSNLFYYPKGFEKETYRKIYGKFEYLNPEVVCFTDFQKEALRVTKLLNKWTPSIFCGDKVKGQVLIKYEYEDGKIKIEMRN